ncbi:MAG: hypothetical protein IJN83_06805, partial [Clostridia bacterium]|nr:hypothetical protein [Clostridia bacterium]
LIYLYPPNHPFKEILPCGKMGALSQVTHDNNAFFMRWSNDHRPPASPLGEATLLSFYGEAVIPVSRLRP